MFPPSPAHTDWISNSTSPILPLIIPHTHDHQLARRCIVPVFLWWFFKKQPFLNISLLNPPDSQHLRFEFWSISTSCVRSLISKVATHVSSFIFPVLEVITKLHISLIGASLEERHHSAHSLNIPTLSSNQITVSRHSAEMHTKTRTAPQNRSSTRSSSNSRLSCCCLAAVSSVRISTIPAFGTIMETVTQKEVRVHVPSGTGPTR